MMPFFASHAPFTRRSYLSGSFAKLACFGAMFATALLLPFATANAFPVTPSAGCTPSPYTSGDLNCTNTGTVTVNNADGIDAPATNGNATTTNSGTVNTNAYVFGIRTSTDIGNATTTNTGSVINTGGGFGIQTSTFTGNATTTNSGTISVSGSRVLPPTGPSPVIGNSGVIAFTLGSNFGIQTSAVTGNATTNNSGTINVSGPGNNFGIFTATSFGALTQFGTAIATSNTATTTNSGNVNVTGNFSTGIFTGAGFFQPFTLPAESANVLVGSISATTNNSGNVNVTGIGSIGIQTTTVFATTAPATASVIAPFTFDASTTNSGSVKVDGTVNTAPSSGVSEGVVAFGLGGGAIGIATVASFGNATTVNSGNVSVTGFNSTGILTSTFTGTATTINSGTVNVVGTANGLPQICVGGCGGNVGIATVALNGNVTVVNTGTVSVTGPNNVGISMSASGTSTLVDTGTISAPGGIAIQFVNPLDPATLTLQPGTFLIGIINMIGAGDTVNVNARNLNLTFNTLAGVTVTGNQPFIVSGNRIVSVDPTGFGITDRSLLDFTRAVSAMLGGRASDAAASAGPTAGGALGFAGYDDSASRFEDPFAQAMGYAKAPDSAMLFKNPTVTTPDGTTVWAKGFYGQRTQPADDTALRTVSRFYGGAIGMDKLVRPDLRLGGLVGGGTINTSIDLNFGSTASDIGFAGVYGRKDFGAAFVDFALLGGHTANRTTRNINNNLVANGIEIATASFGGWFFSPEIAAGYRYDFAPGWSVTPVARLRYLAANYDGFTESGSTANMTAGGRTLENAEERAELTLTRTMWWDTGRIQAGLTGGVLGQQRTGTGNVNAILLGQALAFATPGKSSIAGGYVSGSLDWRMKGGLSLFAAAEYIAMSDSSNIVTGKAGLRYGF
jgi:Autotransporter beta-domain